MEILTAIDKQKRLQSAFRNPMADYLESQRRMQELAKGPVAGLLEPHSQLQQATKGPMADYLESQRRMQELMKGPLASFLTRSVRMQQAIAGLGSAATDNPEEVHDLFDALMSADAPEADDGSRSHLSYWLVFAARLPAIARLRLASQLIGVALSVAAFAQAATEAEIDPTAEKAQAAIGLLFAVVGCLLHFREQSDFD